MVWARRITSPDVGVRGSVVEAAQVGPDLVAVPTRSGQGEQGRVAQGHRPSPADPRRAGRARAAVVSRQALRHPARHWPVRAAAPRRARRARARAARSAWAVTRTQRHLTYQQAPEVSCNGPGQSAESGPGPVSTEEANCHDGHGPNRPGSDPARPAPDHAHQPAQGGRDRPAGPPARHRSPQPHQRDVPGSRKATGHAHTRTCSTTNNQDASPPRRSSRAPHGGGHDPRAESPPRPGERSSP
jgi:hypothetical protein